MKTKSILFVLFFNFIAFVGFSQEIDVRIADKKYETYAYIDAIAIYERIAEKGYKSADLFQKLANSYYFNSQPEKAAKWYGELFALKTSVTPEYYYRYAQTLKSVGDYGKSDQMMKEFTKLAPKDNRAKNFASRKNYLEEIKKNSGRYEIADAGVNTEYSDYGSAFYGNSLIFASAREEGIIANTKHKWTDQNFTNLYSAERNGEALGAAQKFDKNIQSRFHEATPVFTKDGHTMYFTRNNYNNGKKGKNSENVVLIKIYKATLIDGKWDNVTELPFNNDNYSAAHPALSPDETMLYFASDMPGTVGQSDLFRVKINSNGTFGKPENLGNTINTEGKETFPTITSENELYFASDGHPGLGGLDIFLSVIENDNTLGEPINIGTPGNSTKDDFAYLIDPATRSGFLTSNRDGGKGFDDIYRFKEIRKLTCEQVLEGLVTDAETGVILANSKLTLFDGAFTKISETTADAKGLYTFKVSCGKAYYVRGEKEAYQTAEKNIIIAQETGKTQLLIELAKKRQEVAVGSDLAKVLEIKMIYFDLDKADIRPDAALELEKILSVLTQNPKMKIDVRSHTDSRQSHQYNEQLSERRAQSTKAWLVANGIEDSRISAKGYGETQLLNNCADGVKCSDEEHQLNRRSEFIVLEL